MAASNEIMQNVLMNTPLSAHQVDYSFLLPNKRGLDDALAILTRSRDQKLTPNEEVSNPRVDPTISFAVFAAATESFTENNLNCNIATALERFRPVIQGAKDAGHHVRAYISVVLGCPYEGPEVDPQRVAEMATDLMEMGADEIALGDTTGMGTAPRVAALLRAMTAAGVRNEDIAMHFHDTYGQALVNTAVSLEHGIRTFDSSVGGLGGCPFSPGATGNVSTENMIYFLESLGMDTGVDLNAMTDIGQWITEQIGKPNESSVGKAILGRRKVA
jgi:hydroxymethylglutaryl-CoA lyase